MFHRKCYVVFSFPFMILYLPVFLSLHSIAIKYELFFMASKETKFDFMDKKKRFCFLCFVSSRHSLFLLPIRSSSASFLNHFGTDWFCLFEFSAFLEKLDFESRVLSGYPMTN